MVHSTRDVSPYLRSIKDWQVRDIISRYLEAFIMFKEFNQSFSKGEIMSFGNLRKIHDILWDVKEKLHLIFKRVINPKKRIFEQANKFTPTASEIDFMNNVGLLFHKVMVARELKYVLDYYQEEDAGFQETKASLDHNLDRVSALFDQGVELLVQTLVNYRDNIQLLTYFLENKEVCEPLLKRRHEEILKIISGGSALEDIYMAVVRYYQYSGWIHKAEVVLKELLDIRPGHKEATVLLQAINM
ncbi:MAG: hypothetical protein ACOY90_12960 [Candidatus Zhuqueibacterota bacterium]